MARPTGDRPSRARLQSFTQQRLGLRGLPKTREHCARQALRLSDFGYVTEFAIPHKARSAAANASWQFHRIRSAFSLGVFELRNETSGVPSSTNSSAARTQRRPSASAKPRHITSRTAARALP